MTHPEKAMGLFLQGYNCSQAVFLAFDDMYDMEMSAALKLSSAFGAGMGQLREVCGCVSGIFMVLGLLQGYDDPSDREGKKNLYQAVQALSKELEKANGSIICRELLGLKQGEQADGHPSERTKEYYKKRPCAQLCWTAAEILDHYLGIES